MRVATLMWDPDSSAHIAGALVAQGIEVAPFSAASEFIAAHAERAFEAILIEDSMARTDECLLEVEPHIEGQTALIVVGEGGAHNISRALLHGADDYAIRCELSSHHVVQRTIARISAKLRARKSTLKVGAYTLDLATSALQSKGRLVRLTSRELTLARLLFEQCNVLAPTEHLCRELVGRIDGSAERAVQQHAYELRRKLQRVTPSGGEPLRIETVYGKGYRLVG